MVVQTRRLLARAGYGDIDMLLRDGLEGAPERAPFDRGVATVGCPDRSPKWVEQLANDGLLLAPLAHADGHPLFLLRTQQGRLQGRIVRWTGFMPIRGPLHPDDLWPGGIVLADAEGLIQPARSLARLRDRQGRHPFLFPR